MLPLLLIGSFPFKRIHRLQRQLIFLCLGLATYLPLLTILRDLYFLATDTLIDRVWVFVGTIVCVAAGVLHAVLGPHVKRVSIKIANLPAELEGFTIAQLSDLHVGPTIRAPYVEKVVQRTNALKPHLITMTGDIGDGPVRVYRADAQELKGLRAEHGVIYVSGNHEHYWGVQDWMGLMTEMGFTVLSNSVKVIHHQGNTLAVAGLPDPVSKLTPALEAMASEIKSANVKLLLSHRPNPARAASKLGFDLQLSGHTHGGQFFPWTLVVRFVHEFHKGLDRVGEMWIYVNVGTGSWGPFLRLGSTSEITLLTLTKA